MPIASFGGKEFTASTNRIYPFKDISLSGSISTESQERSGQKPATYIKGLGLEALSISIPLIAQTNLNVRDELTSWQTIRDARVPYFFIIGGKPIIKNKLLLKGVEMSEAVIEQNGRILKATLQLQFEEYAAEGNSTKSADKRTNSNYEASLLDDEVIE
jgi:hypothetical protein